MMIPVFVDNLQQPCAASLIAGNKGLKTRVLPPEGIITVLPEPETAVAVPEETPEV